MIIVLSYTLLAILYGPEQRGRMQGLLSGVWGLAAIFGPLVGALLNATLGWRWIFWINLPIGLLGMILLSRTRLAGKGSRRAAMDPATQGLFALAICGAMLALSAIGQGENMVFGPMAGIGGMVALLALFRRLRRAPEWSPVPVAFFHRRDLLAVVVLTLLCSAGLYASVTLLPFSLHAQGQSTLHIGLYIMGAALGWVVGSAACGFALKKIGYRWPTSLGAALLTTGALGLGLTATGGSAFLVAVSECLMGLGMGFVATAALVLSQNIASPDHVGTYTSTIQLLRNLGAALGVNAIAALQFGGGTESRSFAVSFLLLALLMALSMPLALVLPQRYAGVTELRTS